jgi:outer membrane protein OmpA-like peptidoglycan-associated protein
MKLTRILAALVPAVLLFSSPAGAQDDLGRGGVEINGFYGGLNGIGTSEFEEDPVPWSLDNNQYFGGRLGYVLRNGLGIEGFFGYLDSEIQGSAFSRESATAMNWGGDLTYSFNIEKNFQLALLAGAGSQDWDLDVPGLESESALAYNYGAALKIFFTRAFAMRLDWRNYHSPDGLKNARIALNPEGAELEDKSLSTTEWTIGASLFLGGPKDSDGDGVSDGSDACPGTPRGVEVDAVGCPFDSDRDGVADYADACPDTPAGATVDASGCPKDSDSDGVFDGIDQCARTPAGATVDERGCPSDQDGDGVFVGIDLCPNTPAGVRVDLTGCPLDSDNDGVFDGIDQCPDTPAGAEVDERGCTVVQAGVAAGLLVLDNVEFEFNSAALAPASLVTLNEVGQALMTRPEASIEIQGHTDAVGAAGYNMQLSQRRADAVREYLLANFDLQPGQLTSKGLGEADPIASNDTDEGRARNRRVQFVIEE